ncbi:hypothetical protein [Aliiroseovarius sp. 2305UL8-7]|uniref:hypothetical protein n=1 Tax=Aliiroseovarius conchicola TaxID=3121637 RepID=UPI003528D19F
MPKLIKIAIACCAIASAAPALSADWKTRPTDTMMTADQLTQALSGQTLTYYDGGTSAFQTDGKYSYTYGNGGTWFGHYVIGDDSTACVTFVTGVSRCDLYVVSNEKLTVITEEGQRFPIRSVQAN